MTKELYEDFDFHLLNSREFKEDSVREELISPLLNHLGYSASGENKIVRSKNLIHPYVYIGTKKHNVSIIPDYLLKFNNDNFWVLDAKAPWEQIDSGKNVEQAFSYAIHKDIRVKYYALCNGKKFILYHVSKWPPVFEGKLENISNWISTLEKYVGVKNRSKTKPEMVFTPDFGLYLLKSGLAIDATKGIKILHLFVSMPIMTVAKLKDDFYSIQAIIGGLDESTYMVTFDFGKDKYNELLTAVNTDNRKIIQTALEIHPFLHHFQNASQCNVGIACKIGNNIFSNEDEDYCSLEVSEFF